MVICVMGCDLPEIGIKAPRNTVYTLYRGGFVKDVPRVHVATFDADGSEEYNRENCFIAKNLFEKNPELKVKIVYWCEKGYFKK